MSPSELFWRPVGLLHDAQEQFDSFAERAAADWMCGGQMFAVAQQYFLGAEEDALGRQFLASGGRSGLPIDPAVRNARVPLAQRILAQLAAFDPEVCGSFLMRED